MTQDQVDVISQYFSKRTQEYAQAGEEAACGAKVVFEFVPGLGRSITARFDDEAEGLEIEAHCRSRNASYCQRYAAIHSCIFMLRTPLKINSY